jgi:hypothetical protein
MSKPPKKPVVSKAIKDAVNRAEGKPVEKDFSDLDEVFAEPDSLDVSAKPVATRVSRKSRREKAKTKPKPKRKGPGRPIKRTALLEKAILARMMGGESVRKICSDEKMPSRSLVHEWLSDDAANGVEGGFLDQYTRAMEIRAADIFDETIEIADDDDDDFVPDGDGGFAFNREAVQRSKLRIDARHWALARMSSKKYGPKGELALTGADGSAVRVISGDMSAQEAANEFAKYLENGE